MVLISVLLELNQRFSLCVTEIGLRIIHGKFRLGELCLNIVTYDQFCRGSNRAEAVSWFEVWGFVRYILYVLDMSVGAHNACSRASTMTEVDFLLLFQVYIYFQFVRSRAGYFMFR